MDDLKELPHKGECRRLRAWRFSLFVTLFLLAFAQSARARDDLQTSASLLSQSPSKFAIADFDGDNRPDLASVEAGQRDGSNRRYQVSFQLTTGPRQTIAIAAPLGGLRLRSQDVNGDGFPDVVVTTFWTNRPVALLLNDGLGNFSEAEASRFPAAFSSSEVSLKCESNKINDTAAAIFQRYFPGQCEDRARMSSPPCVVRRFASENLHFVASSGNNFFLSRAPPSVHPGN
jgi:hypothetical protein